MMWSRQQPKTTGRLSRCLSKTTGCPLHIWMVLPLVLFPSLAAMTPSSHPAGQRTTPHMMLAKRRQAMQLSMAASQNISAAQEACLYWAEILDEEEASTGSSVPNNDVSSLSLALYGSCLVRTGQDALAVQVLDRALALDPNRQELRVTKAQALQRLLQYTKARQEYQHVPTVVGATGVATCSLRLADLTTAVQSLEDICGLSSMPALEDDIPTALRGLLGVVQYLQTGKWQEEQTGRIRSAAVANELLYQWIEAVARLSDEHDHTDLVVDRGSSSSVNPFLDLILINLSPLDDPCLILLDDKVHLHEVLSKYPQLSSKFWPDGKIVVPRSSSLESLVSPFTGISRTNSKSALFILKERSGYGSHGNRILSNSDMASLCDQPQKVLWKDRSSLSSSSLEEKLLQQMVDPPLLLNGRKFSLRIYVIYFSPTDVYISPDGLVKLASASLMDVQESSSETSSSNSKDPRIHMTNSGRDIGMEQQQLQYLETFLEEKGESFDDFWKKICGVVEDVFGCYRNERIARLKEEWDGRREGLGTPKILGFDFVVDSNHIQPWLVEVNRFPGLEPRDDSDRQVKYKVVHDAWLCAGERKLDRTQNHPFHNLLLSLTNSLTTGHRLQRLHVTDVPE